MIPFAFTYYRPATLGEALSLKQAQPRALWYAGGTEIISMARVGSIRPAAVIDIKALPELRGLEVRSSKLQNGRPQEGKLHMGACLTLSQIAESGLFPLLGQTISRIADHTNQCKITLGGNLAGTIRYREASLPLLLMDATAQVADSSQMPYGNSPALDGSNVRTLPFRDIFTGRLCLPPEALLLSVEVDESCTRWPFAHFKCVRADKIDYPLFTLAAAKDDVGALRFAFSGLWEAPQRSMAMEQALHSTGGSLDARIDAMLEALPSPPLTDTLGSSAYRLFRLRAALKDAIQELEACR